MPEAAGTARAGAEFLDLQEAGPLKAGKDQLGDPLSVRNGERLRSVFDQDRPDLPPVIGVDGPRTYAL
jgi:hypothetical protein